MKHGFALVSHQLTKLIAERKGDGMMISSSCDQFLHCDHRKQWVKAQLNVHMVWGMGMGIYIGLFSWLEEGRKGEEGKERERRSRKDPSRWNCRNIPSQWLWIICIYFTIYFCYFLCIYVLMILTFHWYL